MTEDEALAWLEHRFSKTVVSRLREFVEILRNAATSQNLIAQSTGSSIWARHIVDSAQLVALAPSYGRWVDIGSGAGFPGLVVAILRDQPVTLIEPRRRRADFLARTCEDLNLELVDIIQGNAATYNGSPAATISARAVACIGEIFRLSRGFADLSTTFVLPKGRSASSDLESASRLWQGTFHVKHSVTDAKAGIVIATGVRHR